MKASKTRCGYLCIMLSHKGKRRLMSVHRIVALSFYGINDKDVNHINAIKTDNRLENLEFVTDKENVAHAIKAGLIDYKLEKNSNAKLTNSDVIEILSLIKQGIAPRVLANKFKVSSTTIYDIRSGKRWGELTNVRS